MAWTFIDQCSVVTTIRLLRLNLAKLNVNSALTISMWGQVVSDVSISGFPSYLSNEWNSFELICFPPCKGAPILCNNSLKSSVVPVLISA